MYCPNCGSFLQDGTQNCPNCNEPINQTNVNNGANAQQNDGIYYNPQQNNTYNNVNEPNYNTYSNTQQNNTYYNDAQQNYFNQGQPNNQDYYQACPPNNSEQQFKEIVSSANTLGILAIVLGILLTPLAGIICGAVGLSKLNSLPNIPMNPAIENDKAKARKLNIWGIVLPIALYIILIVLMIIMFTFMGLATASAISFM